MIELREHFPLAPCTTFGIGGPARFYAEVAGLAELREALSFARAEGLPFFLMGGGSNLLISDAGFPGLVIRNTGRALNREGTDVEVEAGVVLIDLVRSCASWGLAGVATLAGIPGLVGGALRGNAGAYGGSLGEVCTSVRVLDAGSLEERIVSRAECRFGYRDSRFKQDPALVVLGTRLSLAPAPVEELEERVAETLAKRAARRLDCEQSVGSYFTNPVVSDRALVARFEAEQRVAAREGRLPAGWLIDQAGLRNLRVGGAQVSGIHANYLINTGGASARDVLELARLVKERVLSQTGVRLVEEVSRIGFSAGELAD
ncbi:UDP-N-acetylenolpyruvoylglucosamine reductase [Geomonas limicola]|uniref:UDP-N-acetylenolpyruvoylglucosamine reductase n=1 Tax=Geomonas limicola TaxID=2740186 RepID=A0A6V8ND69_9BACT|nr:UDP-N-acetylmuramate dehydrogenase [Geomonas limicola]GFO70486.1 UDP-N-acetylenolpyruvoylglucosamine reductase [Geomonas limicola]